MGGICLPFLFGIMEDINNIYLIKRQLSELQMQYTDTCYHYYIGKSNLGANLPVFVIKIFTYRSGEDFPNYETDRITKHDAVAYHILGADDLFILH